MKMLIKIIGSFVIVSSIFTGAAQAMNPLTDPTFQLGPQFGYSSVGSDGKGTTRFDSSAVGLVARYTARIKNSGFFVGVHTGFLKEFGKEKYSSDIIVDGVRRGPFSVKEKLQWSVDFMPRVGYSFGDFSVSLAGGLSLMQGKLNIDGQGYSGQDKQWHVGWKIAPGIDYKLTKNISLFGQFNYAQYNSATYKSRGYYTKSANPNIYGGRFGVLYSF